MILKTVRKAVDDMARFSGVPLELELTLNPSDYLLLVEEIKLSRLYRYGTRPVIEDLPFLDLVHARVHISVSPCIPEYDALLQERQP